MIYVILPAYNEEGNINRLLTNLIKGLTELGEKYHIVFVDDGSSDNTRGEILKFKDKASLEVISHHGNLGVGEAFRSGFKRVLSLADDNDVIVTKEADNTSDVGILVKMLKKLKSGDDIVLASCFAKEGKIVNSSWERYLCSMAANLLL